MMSFNNLKNAFSEMSDSDFLGFVILMVVFAVVAIWMLLPGRLIKRTKNIGKKINDKRRREVQAEKRAQALYSFLMRVPLVNRGISGLTETYRLICPYDEATLKRKVIRCVRKASHAALLTGTVLLVVNVSLLKGLDLFTIVVAGLAVYVVCNEVIIADIASLRQAIESELSFYFVNVKHEYEGSRSILNAIINASDGLSYEVRKHAMYIYGLLTREKAEEAVRDYVNDRTRNRYLRLFVGQAYEVLEGGEDVADEGSVFSRNIETLRMEMVSSGIDVLKKRWKLSGYALVTVLPALCMNVFKVWGLSFDDQSVEFYSSYGPFIQIITIAITIVVYDMINHSKNLSSRFFMGAVSGEGEQLGYIGRKTKLNAVADKFPSRVKEHIGQMLRRTGSNVSVRMFLVKIIIYSLLGFAFVVFLIFYAHHNTKVAFLTNIPAYDYKISAVVGRQRETIKDICLGLINTHKDDDLSILSDRQLVREIEKQVPVLSSNTKTEMVAIIRENIASYQSEGWRWYDIFVAMVGLILGFINYLELVYYNSICEREKNSEIREFQLVVLLKKEFRGSTVYGILQELAGHAVFYRDKLQRALALYSYDEKAALDYLGDDDNASFRTLMDGFKNADIVGIKGAFSEVQSNIASDERLEALYSDIDFSKRTNVIEVLSYLPSVLVVGVYFILPFALNSLGGVMDVMELMEGGL